MDDHKIGILAFGSLTDSIQTSPSDKSHLDPPPAD